MKESPNSVRFDSKAITAHPNVVVESTLEQGDLKHKAKPVGGFENFLVYNFHQK